MAILLFTSTVLLAHPYSLSTTPAHTANAASPLVPSYMLVDFTYSRLHPGFASHEDVADSQLWVEQGATAVASRDDSKPTAVALARQPAACDDAAFNAQTNSICTRAIADMAAAAQDQSAIADHTATVLVPRPEEEPAASTPRASNRQAESVRSASEEQDISMQDAVSLLSMDHQSNRALCLDGFSTGNNAQDASSAYATVLAGATTAVEPAPGDLAVDTSTGHTVVVPVQLPLVCTATAHSATALEVEVLGELALDALACPAILLKLP